MNPQLNQLANIRTGLQNLQNSVGELPELTGQDLVEPAKTVDLAGTFQSAPQPSYQNTIKNLSSSIAENQEEARALKEEARALQDNFALLGATPISDFRDELNERFGLPQNLSELKDINLQLADLQTQSNLNKAQSTAGGAGAIQSQRALTLEDKQFAIRSAGLASRAAVLQGNIETARSLINDAMTDLYADREVKLQIAQSQLQRAYDVADNKEKQLLDERNRLIEEEKARIKEVKDAVNQAVLAGASQQEIATLTDANVPDEQKLALAQDIAGRQAREQIDLERETIALQQENLRSQINDRSERLKLAKDQATQATGNLYGTLDSKPQTSAQATANGFADRLLEASGIFDAVESEFADPLAFGDRLPNQLQSVERQQFEQAKRNFVNAVLRRESGAVISPQEFDNAEQQYFAQPGDSDEVLLQKAENRNTVINNFYREANVPRPVFPGDLIVSNGVKYIVGDDGETLSEVIESSPDPVLPNSNSTPAFSL